MESRQKDKMNFINSTRVKFTNYISNEIGSIKCRNVLL